MKGIVRVTDKVSGVCYSHTTPQNVIGMIVSGSNKVFSENLAVARIGDKVIFSCGHQGIISSGSPKIYVDGIGIAVIGDDVIGFGADIVAKITSSSNKVSG